MSKPKTHSIVVLRLVILAVAINGLIIIAGTLFDQFRHHIHLRSETSSNGAAIGLPLIIGLTLLYLSSLLARRKRTAWAIVVPVYTFILGVSLMQMLRFDSSHGFVVYVFLRSILFPLVIVASLIYYRDEFNVKSDIQGFRQSLPVIAIILAVTFIYGTAGFVLMDEHDFHHEIGLTEAMHRTVDQFGLTSDQPLTPYTRRAKVFTDSLSIISVGALVYALILLVQPLRAKYINQAHDRQLMQKLLENNPADSDDFFKLWPHDKLYYVENEQAATLALNVRRGVALVVGDPAGDHNKFNALLNGFMQQCTINDWQPAFIHTKETYRSLYERHGLTMQKVGEEAIINTDNFFDHVADNKYFRHIKNKFEKQGYSVELLKPPHNQQTIRRLSYISKEWLTLPGRVERGLMMGYFSSEYMQLCDILVAKDNSGVMQAFMNQVPSFDEDEANYDLLRHTKSAPGNINDFLLVKFIEHVHKLGFKRLNLGLCPLSGLDKGDSSQGGAIDSTLRFAYANGDRLYSFSGLKRFKEKYEPHWSPRYIVYRGGIRGFTRTLTALNQAMKVKR